MPSIYTTSAKVSRLNDTSGKISGVVIEEIELIPREYAIAEVGRNINMNEVRDAMAKEIAKYMMTDMRVTNRYDGLNEYKISNVTYYKPDLVEMNKSLQTLKSSYTSLYHEKTRLYKELSDANTILYSTWGTFKHFWKRLWR